MSDAVRFECSSDFEQLEHIVEQAESFASAYISDEDLVYKFIFLTSEVFTNAIEHGNGLDPEKKVIVEFEVSNHQLIVAVEDEGGGFQPQEVKDPLQAENMLSDRGRGLFLIEEMADEVQYSNNGRKVRLALHFPTSQA